MSETKIFVLTQEEIKRRLDSKKVDVDQKSQDKVLRALEACVEGGKKILNDSQTREMLRRIY